MTWACVVLLHLVHRNSNSNNTAEQSSAQLQVRYKYEKLILAHFPPLLASARRPSPPQEETQCLDSSCASCSLLAKQGQISNAVSSLLVEIAANARVPILVGTAVISLIPAKAPCLVEFHKPLRDQVGTIKRVTWNPERHIHHSCDSYHLHFFDSCLPLILTTIVVHHDTTGWFLTMEE